MTKCCNALRKLVVTSNDVQKFLSCYTVPRHNKSLSSLSAIYLHGEPPASAVIQFGLVSLLRLAFRNTVISNRNGNSQVDNKIERKKAKERRVCGCYALFSVSLSTFRKKVQYPAWFILRCRRHSSKMSVSFTSLRHYTSE